MQWSRTRGWSCAAILAACCAAGASAADTTEQLTAALAREVAQRTLELTETRAVPPRDGADYARAKQALLATLDSHPQGMPRAQLYQAISVLLATLDSNDHSFIWAPVQRQHSEAGNPVQAVHQSAFAAVATPHGKVLHWSPPPVTAIGPDAVKEYVRRFLAEAEGSRDRAAACALLIDLRGQTGGNAWPVMFAMQPLFGASNTAAFVDRSGTRTPVVYPPVLLQHWRDATGGAPHPMARFAGLPLAVAMGNQTSSAGEMVALALLGEGERVRTFGWPTDGRTTVNQTYALPDGGLLLLTEARYAVGKDIVHGKLRPQQAAQASQAPEGMIAEAAAWAARQSPLCRAPTVAQATQP